MALKLILMNYKKIELNAKVMSKETTDSKEERQKFVTKGGETIEGIQKNVSINTKNLTSIEILNKNQVELNKVLVGAKTPEEKIKKPLPKGIVLMMEGLFIFEATIGTGAGKDRNKVVGTEDHLTQAYNKLKKDIEVLESPKEKGLGIDLNFLDALLTNTKNSESKNLIKSLYNDINIYLLGDRKQTIQEKDPLYKESYEYLMSRIA